MNQWIPEPRHVLCSLVAAVLAYFAGQYFPLVGRETAPPKAQQEFGQMLGTLSARMDRIERKTPGDGDAEPGRILVNTPVPFVVRDK